MINRVTIINADVLAGLGMMNFETKTWCQDVMRFLTEVVLPDGCMAYQRRPFVMDTGKRIKEFERIVGQGRKLGLEGPE